MQRLHVASSNPAKSDVAVALKRLALDRSRPHMTACVFQSNQPLLITDVSMETLGSSFQSEEHRRLWSEVGPTSMMVVPLVVRTV